MKVMLVQHVERDAKVQKRLPKRNLKKHKIKMQKIQSRSQVDRMMMKKLQLKEKRRLGATKNIETNQRAGVCVMSHNYQFSHRIQLLLFGIGPYESILFMPQDSQQRFEGEGC